MIIDLKKIFLLFFVFYYSQNIYATHAAGMDISYEHISQDTVWDGNYQVVINTQIYGGECSWDIKDATGAVVAQGTGYGDYSSYVIDVCVPSGNFTFNWYDSYGDGWHGGNYSVLDNSGSVLTSGSPTTGSSGSSSFTSAGSSCGYSIVTYPANSYKVTLKFYRDCSGVGAPTQIPLNYSSSCGSYSINLNKISGPIDINPTCTTYCNGGSAFGIEEYIYEEVVILSPCSDWVLGACVYARNGSINTIANPGSEDLCVEATLNNSISPNNSPTFTQYPTPFLCAGTNFCYNNGTVEFEGDSLVYELTTPLAAYGPVTYIPPYSPTNPVGGGSAFDVNNGNLCVTPPSTLNGIFAIKVTEFRNGIEIGSIIRDIQVTVFACTSINPPALSAIDSSIVVDINDPITYSIDVCPDGVQPINFNINIINNNPTSPESDVDMTWNNSIPGATFTVSNNNTLNPISTFDWTPNLADTLGSPYFFTVSLINNACPAPGAFSFQYEINLNSSCLPTTPTTPIISNAFISQPILCNGGYATDEMQVEIAQSSPLTEYSLVIGSYNAAGTYFISYLTTNQTTASILNFTGFLPNVDYCIRVVDSAAYYFANGGLASGNSTVGIYDEWCSVNFPEPALLVSTTTVISNNNCVGDCIAVEDLNITGGTAPYTFTLDGGAPIALATGVSSYSFTSLCAGLYDIVVTDANACTGTVAFNVNEPTPFTVSSSNTAVSCSGFSDGTATVLPTGGTSPYTYLWDDPSAQTTATAVNLLSGTYFCNVTDAVGCSAIETVFISEPTTPITVSSSNTSVSCSGFSDGTATVLPTGGTSPYTYLWDDPSAQTTATAVNLLSGTYVCILTDAVGCSFTETVIVSEPPLLNVNITTMDVSCSGGIDGVATLNISGGTPNYTINAYGSSLPLFTNIFISPPGPAGVYPFSITDANGCSFSDIITINEPPPVVNTVVDTACGEYLFGSNLINTSGTYSETFTTINSCDSVVNLQLTIFEDSSVTYLTACDSVQWNGNWYYSSDTVTTTGFTTNNFSGGVSPLNLILNSGFETALTGFPSGDPLPAYPVELNHWTAVNTDGEFILEPSYANSGSGFLSVLQNANANSLNSWLGNNLFGGFDRAGQVVNVIPLQTYNIEFWARCGDGSRYGYGCGNLLVEVEQILPVSLPIISQVFSPSLNFQQFNFSFTAGLNTSEVILLFSAYGSGNTDIWIDDISMISSFTPTGCDSVATAIITINNSSSSTDTQVHCDSYTWPLNGQTYFTSQFDTIHSTNIDGCLHVDSLDLTINYENTGTSTVDTCNTFDWNGQTITISGSYNQTFTNADGCDSVHTLVAIINYSNTGTSTVDTCNTFDWNGQTIITSGIYTQTLTNIAGCDSVHTLVATINYSNTASSSFVACNSYDWDGVTYLSTGTYSNTYTNVSGCDSVHTLNLTINYDNTGTSTVDTCDTYDWNGQTITVSGIYNQTFTNVSGCDSVHTLVATIRYSNTGTSTVIVCDYYDWDGNIYTSSGLYSITYTNVSGCDSVHSLDLTINNSNTGTSAITACDYYVWNGNVITYSGNYSQIFTNVSGCDSTHTLNASINYSDLVTDNVGSHCDSYTWIDGVTYTSSNNTATYTLVNVYGCDSVILLDLTIYQEIIVNATLTDELCVNYADGSIVLNASGGVGAFMYNWTGSSGYSSSDINIYNLVPGTYNLTITDFATYCTKDTFFVINPGFDIQISSVINNVSCYDTADAIIDIIPLNLIAPIYTWSDISVSIEDRVDLSPGTYYVQIDDNSCFLQDTFVITQPDSLFLIAQQTNSVCVGGSLGEISVDVYGGTQYTSGLTYSYYWSNWVNVPTNSSLSYGTYYLTVIDANNCELRDTFDIAPYTIDLLLVNVEPTCNGFSNGSIDLEVLSGYPNFSYSWSNGSNVQDLYNLSQGSYTCTITDIVGCEVDTTIIISEPQPLTSLPYTNNVNCYGENTGTVSLEISGGTEPFNLDWGNIDTNSLFAGVYFYEITDSNGCVLNDSIIITQEDSLEVSFAIIDAQCFNTPTGLIEVIIGLNSGTPPYYFTWNGPNLFYSEGYAVDDLDSLFAGVYDLTITDAYGCGYYVELVVNEPTQISQSVTMVPSSYSGFNISCKGYNNGWIEAQTSGGYLPYYYEWNTGYEGFDADSITQLVAGVYSCIITDGLGCWTEEFYTLNEPQDELVISPLVTTDYNGYDVSCFSSNDGAIDLNVVGGTGIYTYNISDNSLMSSDSIIEVSSGTYGIIVYDSNGCFDEDSISLNAPDELLLELLVFPDTCSRGVGAVDVFVSGGVLNYYYLWETGQITSNVTDLFVGENQLIITDANSCEVMGSVYIEDLEKPLPDFNTMPDHRRYFEQLDNPIIFIDMTECYWQSVASWEWDFGDGTFGSDSITSHVYNEQGGYNVLLTITTEANCIDTISYNVLIDEYDLFIPNAFTPGIADDINTEFKPYGYGISNFRMNIYTRWGERVFETDDIEIGWDGTHYLNGADCIIGIYVYYIEVENIYGEIFKYENQVRLLR